MIDVASLDLCKELYELSGWSFSDYSYPVKSEKTEYQKFRSYHHKAVNRYAYLLENKGGNLDNAIPAYTLGYLLRKLPKFYEEGKTVYLLTVQPNPIGAGWQAHYRFASRTPNSSNTGSRFRQEADTPEDAACLLAIELIKQGVLK